MLNKSFKKLLLEELDVKNQSSRISREIDELLADLASQEEILQKVVFLMTSKNAKSESITELMDIYQAYKKALSQVKDFIQ